MPATVLAERVGWTGSITWFREDVRRLRSEYRRVDPSDRLTWLAGDAAQCDLWFPPRKVPLEDGSTVPLPVMVITAALRFMVAKMVPRRHTPGLGDVAVAAAAGTGPARVDLAHRIRHRRQTAQKASARSPAPGHLAGQPQALRPRVDGSGGTQERVLRDLLHALAGTSARRPTSTPSSASGWPRRTRGWCPRSRPDQSICSTPTGRRCCCCHRACPQWMGQPGPAETCLLRPHRQQ